MKRSAENLAARVMWGAFCVAVGVVIAMVVLGIMGLIGNNG